MGANLKEVRERITSVRSTQQITKAMKMVSAAKLRRAQQAITQMRPYARKLNEMLGNLMANLDGDEAAAFGERAQVNRVLIVLVTSNRGLAGAFNSNLQKEAVKLIHEKYASQYAVGKVRLLPIGKRGFDYFRKRYDHGMINGDFVKLFDDLGFDHVSQLTAKIIEAFLDGSYDAVEVVYSEFKNAATQAAQAVTFLPVTNLDEAEEETTKSHNADYIFEPDKETLLRELIPTILQTTFHSYLLDTHASEHGARMTAMDQATENANELLKDLRISYNKARQEAITKELSEIVGGAAALEG